MSIDTSVLAENVTFINSFASNQGGDMVLASISGSADSSISQSHFSMSRVGTDGIGGSIFAFQIGNLNILGSSFESCGEKDVLGGAIHVEDTNLTLTSTSFTKNLAGEGGAVWAGLVAGSGPSNMSSIPIVFRATNSTFNGNTAQGAGGAIYLSLLDEADILNCTFQGDTAALGMGSAVDAVSVSLLVAPAIPCSPPSQDTVSCTSSSVLSPPAPPLPPLFYPPNLPGPPPDHDSSLAIGLGVGLGCGILLSLILLLWFFWLKKVTASETANKETIDNPMFSPVFSPHPGMTGNQSSITSASLGCDESDGSRVAKQMIDASSSQQATETAPNTTVILIRSPSFQDYDDSAGGNDPMRAIKEVSLVVSQGQDGDMLEIFQPIGQGGSGTVYKGRWRNLDVAVKVRFNTCRRHILGLEY